MIEQLYIDNFRSFKKLHLSRLKRVNIIVGRNASGKTVLMEGIKLGLDGIPASIPWLNQWRGNPTALPPNATAQQFSTLFQDLFHKFNDKEAVSIRVDDSRQKTANVKIFFDQGKATSAPSLGFRPAPSSVPVAIIPLAFERTDFEQRKSTLYVRIDFQSGAIIWEPGQNLGVVSAFFPNMYYGSQPENASWLSNLSVDKRDAEILRALQRQFPFIKAVSSESLVQGLSSVYADVEDLPKKLPLSLVSGGINRLFTFLLGIVTYSGGVVLIDEVENGIFHDLYANIWGSLVENARAYETQLFVSTHSDECLKAALPMISRFPDDVSLLRLHRDHGESIVEYFDGKQLEAALEKNAELRAP